MSEGIDKKAIQSELDNMKRSIARLEQTLSPEDVEVDRYFTLLLAIHNKGGAVTREELHQEAAKLGYSPRGLGGFFVGKKPVLTYVKINEIDYAALTDEGRRVLKRQGLIE